MSPSRTGSSWPALGTSAGILVAGDAQAHAAARAAVAAELAAIDAACSRFRDDSELATVDAARGRPVPVSPLLLEALEVALRAAHLTGGLVDPTIAGALRSAGYDRDFAFVRGSRVRRVRAERVAGWRVVELDRSAGTVRVPAGVRLDLGATAKALAADRAARAAGAAADATGVLVNLGVELEPTVVRGEPERVNRAISNLLDNAIKWSPPGAVVDVTLRDGTLTVRDRGPGFNAADLPHVFERFYRAPVARGKPGSSLGLAIVRQAAEAHGGAVEAANADGGGAIVRVRFSQHAASTGG